MTDFAAKYAFAFEDSDDDSAEGSDKPSNMGPNQKQSSESSQSL